MTTSQTIEFFGENSPLKNAARSNGSFTYELRQQQSDMAVAIAEALDANENLCVEAPTGVGKTFAYLVPAVFHARTTDKPVIISTHTIHLQEQIIEKDIPLLEAVLNCHLSAVVAKGRSNYLCLRKLNDLTDMEQGMLGGDVGGEIAKLINWVEHTKTGDKNELPQGISPNLWSLVCSERGNCLNRNCVFFKSCYLFLARRKVAQANIIITNHAFFFAALAQDDKAEQTYTVADDDDTFEDDRKSHEKKRERLLPKPCAVIIDEGHTLEDNAASHLAIRAESFAILKILNRLYNEERNRGLLVNTEFASVRDAVAAARRMAKLFFTRLIQWMEPQQKNPLRYTVPNHIPNYLAEPCHTVSQLLDTVIRANENDESLQTEYKSLKEGLDEQVAALDIFFGMKQQDYVYWMEITGRDHDELSFNCVPVDVAPLLREKLFSQPPVIITSATLAVDNRLDFFLNRVGAPEAHPLILDTPFDFQSQVRLYVAQSMPDPRDFNSFQAAAAAHLRHFLKQTSGHAFVLFTSYHALNDMAKRLDDFFLDEHIKLLKQGEGLSPRRMIELFKHSKNAVIFGTSSFWTGVDVPGDALSNVIITKLPFAVPDHPLVEARAERERLLGRNDFMDYSVPDAILKFRQGFGRLIRSKTDKGIVVILDSRVLQKRYGRRFLDSIPNCPKEFF